MYFNAPQIVHTMGKGEKVRGVTCFDEEVFIVCNGKAEVQVFDVDTLSLKRRLPVTGLNSAYDLASCAQNSCLYSCNVSGNCVFKIDIKGNTTSWAANGAAYSLSVSSKSNVLVTCNCPSKITEFTTDGRLLRQIPLQQIVPGIYHSVQYSNGQFLVGNETSDKRVYVIDDDGKLVQCYSGLIGSSAGQIRLLFHFVVDTDGFTAAVDYRNNNVVLLNPSLSYVRELIPAKKGLPNSPFRICYNGRRRLIFVVGFDDGLLSVFKGETAN